MTTNPLKRFEQHETGARRIVRGDKSTEIERTGQAYIHDLCDAYNRVMSDPARSLGKEWFVTKDGAISLGYTREQEEVNMKKLRAESALFG